jgi:hypothetical protein
MTFSKRQGLSYLTKGFSRSVSAGIGSQERRPPFLGEEQALAVKDADPRGFRKVLIRQVERSRLSPVQTGLARF